jgi:hypothetical protein
VNDTLCDHVIAALVFTHLKMYYYFEMVSNRQ